MGLFSIKTVRAKLTATTMVVMAFVLAILGFVAYFGAQQTLLASVDRELRNRADGMADPRGGPPPGGPPGFGLFGLGNGPPPRPRNNMPGLKPIIVPVQGDGTLGLDHDKPYDMTAAMKARNRWAGYSDVTVDDSPVRLYTRPRFRGNVVGAIVQVPYDTSDIVRSLAYLRTVLLVIVIPLGVVLAGIAGRFIVDRLINPIRDMTAKAEELSAHNLSDRLPVRGEDEFAALATTLNAMLGRLEIAFDAEQATLRQLEESIIQQRRFTADASHELKTPLAVIKANTGLVLHMDGTLADYREAVQQIDEASTRMNRLVSDLLVLARADAGQLNKRFEKCDLSAIVVEAVQQVPGADSRVRVKLPEQEAWVEGSKDDLMRVFVNLIDNAIRYSPAAATIELDVCRSASEVIATVRDDGPGIAEEHLEHLFDRFYRVDKSRASDTGGTGLGLAICRGVVLAHRGHILVSSELERGTTFTISLPAAV